jgi:predicted dehydrogenase
VTAGRKNSLRYELAGEKGALYWNSENPEELWMGRRTGPNEVLMRDPSLLSGPARAAIGVPGGHAEGYADTFKQHFRAFYGYIAKGDFSAPPPFATFQDGHREVVLCEAVLESHRKGGWVKVAGVV